AAGTSVYYYIQGTSVSGKTQVRPITAPAGYWKFNVLSTVGIAEQSGINHVGTPYPNPAKSFAAVSINVNSAVITSISLKDMTGRKVRDVYSGSIEAGERLISID